MEPIMIDKNSRYWNDDALMLEAYVNRGQNWLNTAFKVQGYIWEYEIYDAFGERTKLPINVRHKYAPNKMVALNPVWVEKDHSPCLMITPEIITLR